MKKRIAIVLIASFLWIGQALALDFVVEKIQFIGLQRINQDTAFSYLPLHAGDRITPASSDQIIQDLYKTGFFSNVELLRDGNTLIVQVSERPVISKIMITGNKVIPSKELNKVLKEMKVAEGYEYNRAILNTIKAALISQYYSHGKYNAQVNISVTPEKNNSVALTINISEGLTATIKQISIIGNHVFSEKELHQQFSLTTPNLLSFYTHNDQYASEKLEGDIENIRSYYLDRGYLRFQIESTQVSMTPDRKHVYIVIKIIEGPQYKFAGYDLQGNLILPRDQLQKLVMVKKGEVFSRKKVIATEKAIGDALGNTGYFHAQVKTDTKVDEENKTVFIIFQVDPGPRIYVRHINFTSSTNTNDFAFRRTLQQMEGSLISTRSLEDSKQSLLSLPFVSPGGVDVDTKPVPNAPNQVDVDYKVSTLPAGEVKGSIGYSDANGLLLGASVNQQNIFGTGNSFKAEVNYNKSSLGADIEYYNPFYTPSGVGRGFTIYGNHYNAKAINITNYATNNYGAAINYTIPVASHDSLAIGYGLDYISLQTSNNPATVVQDFIHQHGSAFWQIPVNVSWSHATLNRMLFPTRGIKQDVYFTITAPINSKSLEYYKATYDIVYFHPIYWDFVGKIGGQVGYGRGYGSFKNLPFFKNYYVGGIGSVRGYQANSIGPLDSDNDAVGGNMMFAASASLIFPNPFSKSLRTSWFVDAGNVYNTDGKQPGVSNSSGRIRVGTGLEFDWLSPLGLLNFSLAKAVNPTKQDDTKWFDFTMGTTF